MFKFTIEKSDTLFWVSIIPVYGHNTYDHRLVDEIDDLMLPFSIDGRDVVIETPLDLPFLITDYGFVTCPGVGYQTPEGQGVVVSTMELPDLSEFVEEPVIETITVDVKSTVVANVAGLLPPAASAVEAAAIEVEAVAIEVEAAATAVEVEAVAIEVEAVVVPAPVTSSTSVSASTLGAPKSCHISNVVDRMVKARKKALARTKAASVSVSVPALVPAAPTPTPAPLSVPTAITKPILKVKAATPKPVLKPRRDALPKPVPCKTINPALQRGLKTA